MLKADLPEVALSRYVGFDSQGVLFSSQCLEGDGRTTPSRGQLVDLSR
jgi:hypothetical protein